MTVNCRSLRSQQQENELTTLIAMPPHFMWTQKLHSSHCIDLWFVATGFWHIPHGKRIGPGLLCISIASISVSNRNNFTIAPRIDHHQQLTSYDFKETFYLSIKPWNSLTPSLNLCIQSIKITHLLFVCYIGFKTILVSYWKSFADQDHLLLASTYLADYLRNMMGIPVTN
jgi:hypothetical protein